MSVFFKISDEGNCVYVAKTLISSEISKEEFDNKAVRLTVDEFLSKFPKIISEKLETNINRVKAIKEMKLSILGQMSVSNPITRTTTAVYYVGDKTFAQDFGEEEKHHEFETAVKYGKEFYGEEFMNENVERLRSQIEQRFFSGTKEITKAEYKSLLEEKENLTNIVCLQKQKKQIAKM